MEADETPLEVALPVGSLRGYKRWSDANPDGFTVFAYIRNEIRAENVAIVSKLLVPDVLEVDGRLFLSEMFRQSTYDAWSQRATDPVAVQRVMNHVHLDDFFADEEPIPHELMLYLGAIVRTSWLSVLSRRFPGRSIEVEFSCGGSSGGLDEHTLTLIDGGRASSLLGTRA